MNINIALDSNYFKPYTFQDIIAPAALFKQDWEADQERYQSIAEQLGNLEAAVQNTQIAKGLYDAYNTEFQSAVDEFNTGKLNKTRLSKLRNRYNTEMKKVQNANELFSKEAARRMSLLEKDPTMIFSDIGTLDDYITNPNRVSRNFSKEAIRQQVAQDMSAIGKGLSDIGKTGKLDNYTYTVLQRNGFSPEEVQNFISRYNSNDPTLESHLFSRIMNNVIDSSGIKDWASQEDINDATLYALRGLYSGIGEAKTSTLESYGDKQALQHYYHELQANNALQRQKDLARYNATLNGSTTKNKDTGFVSTPIGAAGLDKETTERLNRLRGLKDVYAQDGKTVTGLTTDALNEKRQKLAEANAELQKYEKEHQQYLTDYKNHRHFTSQSKTGGIRQQPVGYAEWETRIKKVEAAQKSYDDEQQFIKDTYDRYKHLSPDINQAVRLGIDLDNAQKNQQVSQFTPKVSETDTKKAEEGITRGLLSMNSKDYSKNNGLIDQDGDLVDFDTMQEMLKDTENLNVKVLTGGNRTGIYLNYKGKDYTIASGNVNSFERNMKAADKFLSDFSKEALDSSKVLQIEDINELSTNGMYINPKMITKVGDYKGLIVQQEDGTYYKILLDNSNGIIGMNTIVDEITGGQSRSDTLNKFTTTFFNGLLTE